MATNGFEFMPTLRDVPCNRGWAILQRKKVLNHPDNIIKLRVMYCIMGPLSVTSKTVQKVSLSLNEVKNVVIGEFMLC